MSDSVPEYSINDLIAKRHSPFAFENCPIPDTDLLALLEAARWSASAGNEQPWSYIVAKREDTEQFEQMLGCVAEVNFSWAQQAAVLIVGCVRTTQPGTGVRYETAEHDLGLASANLVFEATARGIGVHQMTYIDRKRLRALYLVPEDVKVVTMLAIGYEGRENNGWRRSRKPLESFVFSQSWAHTSPLLKTHAG